MDRITLTKSQARKIILHAAGLAKRAQFGKGIEAVFRFIDHLGFLQVDTIYVVERAHHHSIATRVPDYKPEWLEQLQIDGRIFEFWNYASGFIPMADFRFSIPVKKSFAAHREPLTQPEINLMKKVLDRISREGPLRASDFEYDRVTKSRGWWDWRPSKLALERLHLEGSLTTFRKNNFLKIYDLTSNVIPGTVDQTPPGIEEFLRHMILRSLKAFGIANMKEIAFRSRYVRISIKDQLQKLVNEGKVCEVEIEGLKGIPYYMLPTYKKKKIVLAGDVFILSPFDILNVYRQRLPVFFNFDYMVECFVPKSKRKYGYFSLPVLVGDKFVARIDCKADRKESTLIINNFHFEAIKLSKPVMIKIADAILAYSKFNQCQRIIIKKSNDQAKSKAILKGISRNGG